jgi:hypothetical protein
MVIDSRRPTFQQFLYIDRTTQTKRVKTEKILALLFIIALILKLAHIPGANILLILVLSSAMFCYMLLAFYLFSDKEIKQQNIALSIVSGLLLCTVPTGILFKLMFWPGAKEQLSMGLLISPIILIVVYSLKKKAPQNLIVYYKNMFTRLTILTVLVFVFYFIPTPALIKILCWGNPELARIKTLYITNPDNEEYARQYQDYMERNNPGEYHRDK